MLYKKLGLLSKIPNTCFYNMFSLNVNSALMSVSRFGNSILITVPIDIGGYRVIYLDNFDNIKIVYPNNYVIIIYPNGVVDLQYFSIQLNDRFKTIFLPYDPSVQIISKYFSFLSLNGDTVVFIVLPKSPNSIRQLQNLTYVLASPSINKFKTVNLQKHQKYLILKFKPEYLIEIYTTTRNNTYLTIYEVLENGELKWVGSWENDLIIRAIREFEWLIRIREIKQILDKVIN